MPKKISPALPRPQYVPQPEAYLSAMAWKLLQVPSIASDPQLLPDTPMEQSDKPVGLLFRSGGSSSKIVEVRETLPRGDRLDHFAAALKKSGLQISGSSRDLADAVLNSLDGVRVERSGNQPASPLTPALALLQNMRGVLGVKNPPDVAAIVETMFALGSGADPKLLTASRLWFRASNHRMSVDPLLAALDIAVDQSILGSQRRPPTDHPLSLPASVSEAPPELPGTPFEWFAVAWVRLTSDEWVEALPARVWVDWATTILRLATGLGYLWECAWYEALGRSILKPEHESWEQVRSAVGQVLPWRSSRSGMAALDVAPGLIARIHRSERIRTQLGDWAKDGNDSSDDFGLRLAAMRDDPILVDQVVHAMRSNAPTNSGGNLWEAIKYALNTRETRESHGDYYGLLQPNGRYLTVRPGTEWIAVVASLSCVHPGGSTDVSQLMTDIEKLGMRPELSDLISLLERAGLARGSADADQGVRVESAF